MLSDIDTKLFKKCVMAITASTPSCQVIKVLYMISERERIIMNYPHGSLISFVTPLLFDACTDLSRPKRLVIIVCSFPMFSLSLYM